MQNVYLVPKVEGMYTGVVSKTTPENGILLVADGTYPVKVKYKRHNERMKEQMKEITVCNQYELAEWLEFIGAARNVIVSIWEYNNKPTPQLKQLFDWSVKRKAEIWKEEYGTV